MADRHIEMPMASRSLAHILEDVLAHVQRRISASDSASVCTVPDEDQETVPIGSRFIWLKLPVLETGCHHCIEERSKARR
jgi:hypothetical protein